jgi:hypothetical protein
MPASAEPTAKDRSLVRRELAHEGHRLVVLGQRLFEIDDMDLAARPEDVLCHLRVPTTGLMSEVNTCFK